MKLLDFINSNLENWKEKLSQKPYYLKITEKFPYFTLKYDMLESDFNYEEVWDARGLIIRYDGTKYIPISFGLRKFFNATEKWASPIDWATARVQAKIDGSNIRFAFDPIEQCWLCSTMGNPSAKDAPITGDFTFFDAVVEVLGGAKKYNNFLNLLDKNYTYIFELVSKYNIICCHYDEQKLYYISRRNMQTEYEDLNLIHFPGFENVIEYPKSYNLSSYEDCIFAAENLGDNNEGFVVVDSARNRVKIKTPWYIAMHKIRGNGPITVTHIISLYQNDSLDDFIAAFPEHQEYVDEITHKLIDLQKKADIAYDCVKGFGKRKDFAIRAQSYVKPIQSYLFARLDNKVDCAQTYFKQMKAKNLADLIEVKEIGLK